MSTIDETIDVEITQSDKPKRSAKKWADLLRKAKTIRIASITTFSFILLGIIGAFADSTNTTSTKPATKPAATTASQSQPAKPAQPTTLDQLWQSLDNSGESRDTVRIDFT